MTVNFRRYQSFADFIEIRDLLVNSYQLFGRPYNWLIDRWNFSFALSRSMHAIPLAAWEETVGSWESKGELIAVVHAGAEESGEAFFEIGRYPIASATLREMFVFAEENLAWPRENFRVLNLRIPEGDEQREAMASQRGYVKLEQSEPMSMLEIVHSQHAACPCPKGFSIVTGDQISDIAKGRVHAKAFGYINTPYVARSPIGYELLRSMPNYRSDLDLYVLSATGEIVAFCTMWYDAVNQIGILEPVGTIPTYRKKGLARAVIAQALRLIAQEGATKAFVGSGQVFYQAIGFKKSYQTNIWKKEL